MAKTPIEQMVDAVKLLDKELNDPHKYVKFHKSPHKEDSREDELHRIRYEIINAAINMQFAATQFDDVLPELGEILSDWKRAGDLIQE